MFDLDKRTGTTILRRWGERVPPRSWGSWLIGSPLPTADAPHQTVGIPIGLAIFASDALSSAADASQEILFIPVAAGLGAFGFAVPISGVIAGLLVVVVLSYEQIIHAYPDGGGAYIVARDNLGEKAVLIAGAALLTDYILTVAVSISAGVAELLSAVPALFSYRVVLAVAMVLVIIIVNLRGGRESGSWSLVGSCTKLAPTYNTSEVGNPEWSSTDSVRGAPLW